MVAETDVVIFDLGRVLVGIGVDGAKFSALMRDLGVPPEQAFAKYWQTGEVVDHMTGAIDSREFHRLVCERAGIACSFADFTAAWNDIFVPWPDMADLFQEVAARHRVGILSDTDPLHWRRLRELYPWLDRVARPTLSFEVGRLKPHPDMYRAAARNCGAPAERCLFIDDIEANVGGAIDCGMAGLRFTGGDQVRRDLAGMGIL